MRKSEFTRDDPEQAARFIAFAKETGADETLEGADKAFKKAATKKGK